MKINPKRENTKVYKRLTNNKINYQSGNTHFDINI